MISTLKLRPSVSLENAYNNFSSRYDQEGNSNCCDYTCDECDSACDECDYTCDECDSSGEDE